MTRPRRFIALLGALGTLASGVLASPVHAAGVDAGDVVVVDPGNPDTPLSGGQSATYFGLRLPADATCPGDSEHDDRRVQSFIVPATDDLTALQFRGTKPEGDGRWALYQANTETYASILTLRNDVAGQPAKLDLLPSFTFSVYDLTYLPPGRYKIGIACSHLKEMEKFWDAEVEIVADAGDQPGGFTWSVVDAPRGAEPAPADLPVDKDGAPTMLIAIAAIGAFVILLTFIPRRKRSATPRTEETV